MRRPHDPSSGVRVGVRVGGRELMAELSEAQELRGQPESRPLTGVFAAKWMAITYECVCCSPSKTVRARSVREGSRAPMTTTMSPG